MLRRPTITVGLLIFLGGVVAIGAISGHLISGLGFAAFLLYLSAIDGKPAWRYWYDAAGKTDRGGRSEKFSWRRMDPPRPYEHRPPRRYGDE
jgi:hypothetical protein